jgi:hypothetical protein
MHFYEEFRFSLNCRMNRFDQLYGLQEFFSGKFKVAIAERVEFEGTVSLGDHGLRRRMEGIWRALNSIPAIGVSGDPVIYLATQELIDWKAGLFANAVPTRHLQQRKAGHDNLAGGAKIEKRKPLIETFNVMDIVANDMMADILQIFLNGVCLANDMSLSASTDAFARFKYKIGQISPSRWDGPAAVISNFHFNSPSRWTPSYMREDFFTVPAPIETAPPSLQDG